MTNEDGMLVIGAGAVGGTVGGLLARSGRRVAFLVHRREAAERISREGLRLTGLRGAFTVRVEASHRVGDLRGPFGAALLAVKAYDTARALRPALGLVPPDALVASLQNGVTLDELEALVGADRAVGCVVGWGATLHPDGTVELTAEGKLVIGSRSPGARVRLESLRAALSAAFPVTISEDILASLVSKLLINCSTATLGAISGQTLGWMLRRRSCRELFIAILREGMAVADAMAIRVPPYAGRLDFSAFLRGDQAWDRLRRHAIIRLMGARYRREKSTGLQSLQRGRPTETEWLNGWISRMGRLRGVATPLNDRLTGMVHEIEAGARSIGPHNLEEPLPGRS
jgi:2-dehydropantoate 2-reductase